MWLTRRCVLESGVLTSSQDNYTVTVRSEGDWEEEEEEEEEGEEEQEEELEAEEGEEEEEEEEGSCFLLQTLWFLPSSPPPLALSSVTPSVYHTRQGLFELVHANKRTRR
ncbi:unnamed protein product [Boreogadus saida]